MSRKPFCKACSNKKYGIKTRIAVFHTCNDHLPTESHISHEWKIGEWVRPKDNWGYWKRIDKCLRCGITRQVNRDNKKSESYIYDYARNKVDYKYEPDCDWNKELR